MLIIEKENINFDINSEHIYEDPRHICDEEFLPDQEPLYKFDLFKFYNNLNDKIKH